MQITVEEIRRVKSKPDAEKKWELVALVAKGQEFTTFDLAVAKVGIGGVIEFDMELTDSGKMNIKKGWKIISKGEEPTSGQKSTALPNGGGESPEKRQSIEDQNRAGHITNLWIAGKIPDDDSLVAKLRAWLGRLGSAEPAKKAEEKVEKKAEEPGKSMVDLDWLAESLITLESKKLPAWEEESLLGFMKKSYQVEGKTVLEAAAKLDKGKAAHFVKRIEEAIDWNSLGGKG